MWSHLCKNGRCRKGWAKWGYILPSSDRYLSIKQEALELCVAQWVLIKWNVAIFFLPEMIPHLLPLPHSLSLSSSLQWSNARSGIWSHPKWRECYPPDRPGQQYHSQCVSFSATEGENRWVVIQGKRSWYKYVVMKDILALIILLVWLFYSVI